MVVAALTACSNSNLSDSGAETTDPAKTYPVTLAANTYSVLAGCHDNNMETGTLYIVHSQTELASLVPCASAVSDIDWKKESLLITMDSRCNADSKVIERTFEETSENKFLFKLTVYPGKTTLATLLIIYTKVPKLPNNADVSFKLIIPETENGDNNQTDDKTQGSITGCKWKLTGFGDGSDDSFKNPEPATDDCYWVVFNADNSLNGKSSTNEIAGNFTVNYETSSIKISNLGGTKIGEIKDGDLFMESMRGILRFELSEKSILLYCKNGKYLKFNKL